MRRGWMRPALRNRQQGLLLCQRNVESIRELVEKEGAWTEKGRETCRCSVITLRFPAERPDSKEPCVLRLPELFCRLSITVLPERPVWGSGKSWEP